jgi:hypothetical protein
MGITLVASERGVLGITTTLAKSKAIKMHVRRNWNFFSM